MCKCHHWETFKVGPWLFCLSHHADPASVTLYVRNPTIGPEYHPVATIAHVGYLAMFELPPELGLALDPRGCLETLFPPPEKSP